MRSTRSDHDGLEKATVLEFRCESHGVLGESHLVCEPAKDGILMFCGVVPT